MNFYEDIIRKQTRDLAISSELVGHFLIYYAAMKNGVDRVFDHKTSRYRHILKKMPKEWTNFLKSQFIAHELFKKDGLINKYLNHSEIKLRSGKELEYLKFQKNHPWRYTFCEIIDQPYQDFYMMRDLFSDDEFLLYTQGVSDTIADSSPVRTWLLLTSHIEDCRISYGPIMNFRSFDHYDFAFFARELNPDLETDEEIAGYIDDNPLPFTMLWKGTRIPLIFQKDYLLRFTRAIYSFEDKFNSEVFKKHFAIEYSDNFYRLKLKDYDSYPHFALAYYEEDIDTFHLTSQTPEGFLKLVEAVRDCGFEVSAEPDDMVSPGMLTTASDILKRDIQFNPFDENFIPETESDDDKFEGLNRFTDLLMNTLIRHEKPDVKKMAEEAGINYELAATIMEQIQNKLNRI